MNLLNINSSGLESFFQLIVVLFIFLLVLALTYFTTKWIARYQKGVATNKNIRVIETFRVTNNKFIQIIEIGEVYLVISVCKDTIGILTELTKEQMTWMPSKDEFRAGTGTEAFQDILKKLKEKIPKK
ncbi:flagellar biosynthetic protein FliO [Lachnospiraceae bacterium ZAX-1]